MYDFFTGTSVAKDTHKKTIRRTVKRGEIFCFYIQYRINIYTGETTKIYNMATPTTISTTRFTTNIIKK
jgi:hypothetical protein